MNARSTLPTFGQLVALDSLAESQTCDLRIDEDGLRVWTSRCSVDDGEPFDETVYVEILDESGRWLDVGHYDGSDAPYGLPGVTPGMFSGLVGR